MYAAWRVRRGFRQLPLHAVGHRRPDRAIFGVFEARNQLVEQGVRFGAESVPIRGIEQRGRGFLLRLRHFDFCFRFGL
jgi:hypothetical protein